MFFRVDGWLIDRINDVERGSIRGEDGNESGAFRGEERGMERRGKVRDKKTDTSGSGQYRFV